MSFYVPFALLPCWLTVIYSSQSKSSDRMMRDCSLPFSSTVSFISLCILAHCSSLASSVTTQCSLQIQVWQKRKKMSIQWYRVYQIPARLLFETSSQCSCRSQIRSQITVFLLKMSRFVPLSFWWPTLTEIVYLRPWSPFVGRYFSSSGRNQVRSNDTWISLCWN